MNADDQRRADALNELWDAIQRGDRSENKQPEIDPFTRQLMARLRARKPTPDLDPARERVWQDLRQRMLMKEPDMDAMLYPPGTRSIPIGRPTTNGRVKPTRAPFRPRSIARTSHWLATTGATVALLLLALAAIYF